MVREIENKAGLRIKGAVNHNDKILDGVESPLPNWSYFCSFIAGVAGSGKSSLITSMLTDYRMYREKFNFIYFFSPSLHTLPDEFKDELAPERTFTSLEKFEDTLKEIRETKEGNVLMVFDDCVKEIGEHKKEFKNLVFNRRHQGGASVSIMIITQKITSIPLEIRSGVDSVYFFSLTSKREADACFKDYASTFLDKDEWEDIVKYIITKEEKNPFIYLNLKNGKIYNKFNQVMPF